LSSQFCAVCKLGQDDETVHCKYCDRCVEGHIQHCLFLGSCIGKQNKGYFFISLALLHGLFLVLIWLHVHCISSWVPKFWPTIGLSLALGLEIFLMMATYAATCDKKSVNKSVII